MQPRGQLLRKRHCKPEIRLSETINRKKLREPLPSLRPNYGSVREVHVKPLKGLHMGSLMPFTTSLVMRDHKNVAIRELLPPKSHLLFWAGSILLCSPSNSSLRTMTYKIAGPLGDP